MLYLSSLSRAKTIIVHRETFPPCHSAREPEKSAYSRNIQVLSEVINIENLDTSSSGKLRVVIFFLTSRKHFAFFHRLRKHTLGSPQQNISQEYWKDQGEIRIKGINRMLRAFILRRFPHRSCHLCEINI